MTPMAPRALRRQTLRGGARAFTAAPPPAGAFDAVARAAIAGMLAMMTMMMMVTTWGDNSDAANSDGSAAQGREDDAAAAAAAAAVAAAAGIATWIAWRWLWPEKEQDEERVLVVPEVGVQVEAHVKGARRREFFAVDQIEAVVVHEAITWCRVEFFLALVVPSRGKLVVLFPRTQPPLREIQAVLLEITELLRLDDDTPGAGDGGGKE